MRNLLKMLLLLTLGMSVSCGRDDGRVNVVIIGIDTLRRDHVGCYGYDRPTTPNIDAFARRGAIFENTVSQAPWTLPSFATVFTSLYPSQHGATSRDDRLRDEFPTLGTILQENGYATGALVNAPVMAPAYRLDRGFDYYSCKIGIRDRIADATTAEALEWIDENGHRPFFLFVHYFDPHIPYSPPSPYDTLFAAPGSGQSRKHFYPDRARIHELTPEDWDEIVALYDGEIAFTDAAVHQFLTGLDERGIAGRTLIILLSDHGEEFYDHGGFEHGHTLYDELIKIPLMFVLPGVIPEDTRIPDQVRLLDVCPTILDLLGISLEPHFEGISLKSLLTRGRRSELVDEGKLLPANTAYSEALLPGRSGEDKCIAEHPWKLIYHTQTREAELFNLADDPGEHRNLVDDAGEPLAILDESLSKTLFGVSDTWYVEIHGGESGAVFDVSLNTLTQAGSNRFGVVRLKDPGGRLLSPDGLPDVNVSPTGLELRSIEAAEPLTIAFTLDAEKKPVSFSVSVDGKPALKNTYLGSSLSRPTSIPFLEDPSEAEEGRPDPGRLPDPPFVLIWHSGSAYKGNTSIRLDAETKRALRAVGYMQ